MSAIPESARDVLEHGTLCYLGAPSRLGPHVTPVVFVLHADRLWLTTSRGAVKSRAWRRDPRAGGLVSHGDRGLTFQGDVTLYDALDPLTWPAIAFRGPTVAIASTRFSLKNARFFAGYARDAYRVPFSWSPPGRVIASVTLERGAVLEATTGRVLERWGSWGAPPETHATYAERRGGTRAYARAPEEVRTLVGRSGDGVLGLAGDRGITVLPAGWSRTDGTFYATLPERFLDLADRGPTARGAFVVDEASTWRASRMKGLLLRGRAELFASSRLSRGRQRLLERVGKGPRPPEPPAVARLVPSTVVWWKGWASGTVGRT